MEEKTFTISEVLMIIKNQLGTIPVSGGHVQTMAAVFNNIDILIKCFDGYKDESEAVTDGGTV